MKPATPYDVAAATAVWRQERAEYLARVRAEALALLNRARAALGYSTLDDFRPGTAGYPDACPLAKSFTEVKLFVGCDSFSLRPVAPVEALERAFETSRMGGDLMVSHPLRLPPPLLAFVRASDAGAYPDLTDVSSPDRPLPITVEEA